MKIVWNSNFVSFLNLLPEFDSNLALVYLGFGLIIGSVLD
jgi:hypothetical protein